LPEGSLIAIPKLRCIGESYEVRLLEYDLPLKAQIEKYYKTLQEFVPEHRQQTKNMRQLATKYGVNVGTVFSWIRGIRSPELNKYPDSVILDEDLAWLFGIFLAEGWVQCKNH